MVRRPSSPTRAAVVDLFRDKRRRAVMFTMASIPGTLLMAAWKGALFVVAPSPSVLATVVFTLGVAVAKAQVVRTHVAVRRGERWATVPAPGSAVAVGAVTAGDAGGRQRRTYRLAGVVVTVLSLVYAASSVPLLLGETHEVRYDRWPAIAIAAVTFAEIGLALHGTVSARRNDDLLAEAVKLTNLAAGLVLLTLAQSALLSIDPTVDVGAANGVSGLVFGSTAAGVGVLMLDRSSSSRSRRSSRSCRSCRSSRS